MSFDRTAIDIDFDPFSRRMRGTTYHGDIDFDVPFISPITDTLWVGGCKNGLVLPKEVKHLVSLYPWEKYDVEHDLDTKLEVRMYDETDDFDEDLVNRVAQWTFNCTNTGVTLVHCQAGLNRSSLVAARALIFGGYSPQSALDHLREKRSPAVLCNPTFEKWVLSQ